MTENINKNKSLDNQELSYYNNLNDIKGLNLPLVNTNKINDYLVRDFKFNSFNSNPENLADHPSNFSKFNLNFYGTNEVINYLLTKIPYNLNKPTNDDSFRNKESYTDQLGRLINFSDLQKEQSSIGLIDDNIIMPKSDSEALMSKDYNVYSLLSDSSRDTLINNQLEEFVRSEMKRNVIEIFLKYLKTKAMFISPLICNKTDTEYIDENPAINVFSQYMKRRNKDILKCPHKSRKHYAKVILQFIKNMCSNCYRKKGRMKKAWLCPHNTKSHYARGKCQNCYLYSYQKDILEYKKKKSPKLEVNKIKAEE